MSRYRKIFNRIFASIFLVVLLCINLQSFATDGEALFKANCASCHKPDKDFTRWYKELREKYTIPFYIDMDGANPFITQVRYQWKDTEIIVMINSNINACYQIRVSPFPGISSGRQAWIWDAENGERHMLPLSTSITLDLGPADLKLLVFDKEKKGSLYKAANNSGEDLIELTGDWSVTGRHVDGTTITKEMHKLKDLKEITEWTNFCGSIIYKTNLELKDKNKMEWLNLGKVFGVSEVLINGANAGVKWYGRRLYNINAFLKNGSNHIEIKVTTTMGNYLKSLVDNRVAQYWTNEGRTIQPLQSMGMAGPVTIY